GWEEVKLMGVGRQRAGGRGRRDGEVDGGADVEPVVVCLPPVVWIPPGAVDAAVVADHKQVELIRVAGHGADSRARRDGEVDGGADAKTVVGGQGAVVGGAPSVEKAAVVSHSGEVARRR